MDFLQLEGEVLPEWIDANGHMNLAYYVVLFDQATDLLYDALGVGQAYRNVTGNSTFTAETHTLYERVCTTSTRCFTPRAATVSLRRSLWRCTSTWRRVAWRRSRLTCR